MHRSRNDCDRGRDAGQSYSTGNVTVNVTTMYSAVENEDVISIERVLSVLESILVAFRTVFLNVKCC